MPQQGQYSTADLAAPAAPSQPGQYSASDLAPSSDPIIRALNYRTGNGFLDSGLGLVQGAVKGALTTIHSAGQVIGQIPIVKAADDAYAHVLGPPQLSEQDWSNATTATTPSQKMGKFGEQVAEYALPAGKAAKALEGAPLLARMTGQALVGSGVSNLQSGGDPTATAAGGVLGAGGELVSAAVGGARALLAGKAPTLANFAESFGGATPTQKARISQALPTLTRDGITPGDSVYETQDAVNGKLADLSTSYQNLDPAIKARPLPVADVVQQLQDAQNQFTRRGVVTDKASYDALQNQIETVQQIAAQNGGNLELDDLVHLKQLANGKTNFQSPDAEKSLWKVIGNTYRGAADVLAPETTPLNRDWATYSDLKQMIDQNIERGKGTTPSGLDLLLKQATQHGVGAAAGASLGGAIAGPPGAAVGGIAGGFFGPKLGKAAVQALQNAADSGALDKLEPGKKLILSAAAKIGDNASVLRILGQSATQEAVTR